VREMRVFGLRTRLFDKIAAESQEFAAFFSRMGQF